MGMGICRLGDVSTGHGGWPSRPNDKASTDVFVNGLGVHRLGDHWSTHCNSKPSCHDGLLSTASLTVIVNGKGCGRIGDNIDCGDVVKTGSANTLAG